MKCGNCFCLFNSEKNCLLAEIELNKSGSCKNCKYVKFPKYLLNLRREEQLQDYLLSE